jgi:hypothetical protein
VTRSPLEAFLLALLDGAIGGAILWAAIDHGEHRGVLVQFFVYAAIVFFFKARDAARRLPVLVTQVRLSSTVLLGPWWLRAARLVLGYDSWSRTERFAIATISVVVCALFGWAKGGPFAAALFLSVAAVNGLLALIAWGARLTAR